MPTWNTNEQPILTTLPIEDSDFGINLAQQFADLKQEVESAVDSIAIGSKDWYTTSTMIAPTATLGAVTTENPVINLTLIAKRAAGQTGPLVFSNLKLASGSAAPNITLTEEESNALLPQIQYDKIADTWIKDIKKAEEIPSWQAKTYASGSLVKHNGYIWIATTTISSPSTEPGVHVSAWKIFFQYPSAHALTISLASTLTINLDTNQIIFTGASTNKIATEKGVFTITAQTVTIPAGQYFVIIYNVATNVARAAGITNDTNGALGKDEFIIGYVLRLSTSNTEVFGIKAYTLVNNGVTTAYPSVGSTSSGALYNRYFSKFAAGRTAAEKEWLNKAIVDLEFYNLPDSHTGVLYGIRKNFSASPSNLAYLGFLIAREGMGNISLYTDEFSNALSMPYDPVLHSGVKSYYLRSGTDKTSPVNIYGKVTIDWDAVPSGNGVLELNSNIINNNSLILRSKYKVSEIFNNFSGFVRFAKPAGLDQYYAAPTLESYASAEGVNSMIPKAPYQDVANWVLKWDELVTNVPDGYTITKSTLTTSVLTDGGTMPMYSYNFKPSGVLQGDPSISNVQVMPKIIIVCSIHGFEKTPSFVVYEFLKQMFTNWQSHPFLEYLRYNVEFSIIPSANPHGWNVNGGIGSRKNFNSVDLNRNHLVRWVASGAPIDSTYSGPSAMSEIETQTLRTWMLNEIRQGTILGIDFHNFHGAVESDPKNYSLSWVFNSGSQLAQSAGAKLIKQLSAKYKEKSPLIPQDEGYYIGTMNNFQGNGFTSVSLFTLGCIHAATLEVAQNFRFNPDFKGHDSDAITYGVETFVNYLRIFLSEFIDEYNRTFY